MGRKTKLTPDVHDKIVTLLRAGAYRAHAAAAAGVSESTVEKWIRRGTETDEEPYATFASDVETAQAEDAVRDITTISKSAQAGDWKAAAWKLERKHPKLFGSIARHQLTGDDGGPLRVESSEASALTDDELEARVREIMSRGTSE